jgi:hypothetical protein
MCPLGLHGSLCSDILTLPGTGGSRVHGTISSLEVFHRKISKTMRGGVLVIPPLLSGKDAAAPKVVRGRRRAENAKGVKIYDY